MSDELAELFNLEVDEFNKKPKSEEEIQKMCTKDDLSELQRATFLLRKGYEIQKLSVINNLHRYSKEVGANEELLSLIIISLEDWDYKMQTECAQAFIAPVKAKTLSKDNRQRLLQVCIQIVTNNENDNQTLKDSWMEVYDQVVGQVDFDYVQLVALKAIQELTDRKSTFANRKLGNRLLFSLVKQCGEQAIDSDRTVLRLIMQICGDTNYKLRMDGAVFLREYLAQNYESLIGTSRLEHTYVPEIIELCNDEDPNIMIEAIEALHYILETLPLEILEQEVMPPIQKLLVSEHEEIQIRVSQFIGSLAYKLSKVDELHLKYMDEIIEFYKTMCIHKLDECRQNAVFSFPCMQQLYKKQFGTVQTMPIIKSSVERTLTGITASTTYDVEESKVDEVYDQLPLEFNQVFFQFATDTNERVRVTAASCIHQCFLAAESDEDISVLRDALHELLTDDCPQVMQALVKNIDIIINKYANQHGIQNYQALEQEPQYLLPSLYLKEKMTTTNRQKSKLSKQFPDYEASPQSTQYLYLPEYQVEQLYTQLLQKVMIFKQNLVKKIALWREAVTMYEKLSCCLFKFHVPELQDKFVTIILEDLKKGNTQLRHMACRCLVQIIVNQHDCHRREVLTDMINQLGQSNYQMRKCFIIFCQEAVGLMTRNKFEVNFYETYFSLSADKISSIRLDFIKSLLTIKPFIDLNPQIHTQLFDCVCILKKDSSTNVAETMEQTDFELLKSRKKLIQQIQAKEVKNIDGQKQIDVREANENEERKKRLDEDEMNGYDQYQGVPYGQTNRMVVKTQKRTLPKAALPSSSKVITVSAATVRRIPVTIVSNTEQKVVTMTKRKIITGNARRNTSALPELNQHVISSDQNKNRKQSILLPTGSSSIFEKQQNHTIPGIGQKDPDFKRYSQIAQVSSQQQQAQKRSNSLLQPPESKSKLVQKKREETAAAVYYQKPKQSQKLTAMLVQSDTSSDSSDLDDIILDNHSIVYKKPILKTFQRQSTYQPKSKY